MRLGIVSLCALVALSFASSSVSVGFAGYGHGHGCNCTDPGPRPLLGYFGVRHCDNCDDAPVVVGGPGVPCGGDCGSCGGECGDCGVGPCGGPNYGVPLACRVFGWIGQIGHHGKCTGCGPKYIPEWHEKPCEPCNNCGDWVGPSIHRAKPYLGAPRSGSNLGSTYSEGIEFSEGMPVQSGPTHAEPKPVPRGTVLPETSVRRVERSSYAAPFTPQARRHRRAAPQAVRTVRVQANQPRTSQPYRGVVIE